MWILTTWKKNICFILSMGCVCCGLWASCLDKIVFVTQNLCLVWMHRKYEDPILFSFRLLFQMLCVFLMPFATILKLNVIVGWSKPTKTVVYEWLFAITNTHYRCWTLHVYYLLVLMLTRQEKFSMSFPLLFFFLLFSHSSYNILIAI